MKSKYYWVNFGDAWGLWENRPGDCRRCVRRLYSVYPGSWCGVDLRDNRKWLGEWNDLEEAKGQLALPFIMEMF